MLGRTKCRSWRPRVDTPHDAHHLPGDCRRCWRLCGRPAQNGSPRCDTCEFDLAQHPDSRVRMALVQEGNIGESTLSLMTNDGDAGVAGLAKTAAYRREHRLERPLPGRADTNAFSVAPEPLGADSWLSEISQSIQFADTPSREQVLRHG